MPHLKLVLFVVLSLVTVWFVVQWTWRTRKGWTETTHVDRQHAVFHAAVAFVCTFFDTLGIGNFAPTTSAFKLRGSLADEKIPGTLNVGYAIPTIAQAFIFITAVDVDPTTLTLMIAAAVVGAWLGAGIVAHLPRRTIQLGMGAALLAAAVLTGLRQFELFPAGGNAVALQGVKLAIGLAAMFSLGALMTLGIGLYAPCLILVSLLGMNETTAFPIMMGSCAFLMPVGGLKFIREGSYHARTALLLTLAGLPAVWIAAPLVTMIPLYDVRWLVVVAVSCAALMMLRSAWTERSPRSSCR